MGIRKLFVLCAVISTVILGYFFAGLYEISLLRKSSQDKSDFSYEVAATVSQLNILTNSYVLYHEPRVHIQWLTHWDRLHNLLLENKFKDSDSKQLVDLIRKRSKKIQSLFDRTVKAEKINEGNSDNFQERALASQLLNMMFVMDNAAGRLYESSKSERNAVEEQYRLYINYLILAMAIMLILLFVVFFIRIIRPIQDIQSQLKSFNPESPKSEIVLDRKDEFGNLVRSFNVMTKSLQTTLVSRKTLQEEINAKERLERNLNTFFEQPIHYHLITDMDGLIHRANSAWKTSLGYKAKELEGCHLTDFIHQDDKKDISAILKTISDGVSINAVDLRFLINNKEQNRLLQWSASPSSDNTFIYFSASDITVQREGIKEQERLQRELHQSQKMDALGKLSGGIAHDFNNILAIILGYIELAQETNQTNNPALMATYLDIIKTSSVRARDLVSQMLLFSRSDQGERKPTDISPIIAESVSMLTSLLPASIEVDYECHDNLPKVNLNAIKLQQIMMNLCLNAKDAMGGIGKLSVNIRMVNDVNLECSSCHQEVKGDWLQLSIKDTGTGITDDELPHIFEPFYTTKDANKGTGMGLSVVDGIVRGVGGHIVVESSIGKGTEFHILFPPLGHFQSLEKKDEEDKTNLKKTGKGQKILLIDDEEQILRLLSEVLELSGYQPVTKSISQEAVDLFLENPDGFSLVISDLTMPGLTGIQVAHKLHQSCPELPIILMTGYSDAITEKQIKDLGITILNKPARINELLDLVSELV